MSRLICIALLFLLASCSTFDSQGQSTAIQVATYNVKTQEVSGFRKALFRNTFQNGSRIDELSVKRLQDGFYLVRQSSYGAAAGSTGPTCRTESLRLSDNGRGRLTLGSSPQFHLCTGTNCNRCGYLTAGCICLESIDKLGASSCSYQSMGISRAELLVPGAEGPAHN
jgi:hypothetical protein